VKGDQALEIVREFSTVFRLSFHEGIASRIVGVPQMVGARELREHTAVVQDPADTDAPEAYTMITALAPYETRSCALADGALIGDRDL
jgi:hypothetical protein